jgi:hypothetical protein
MPVLVAFQSAAGTDVEKVKALFLAMGKGAPICEALGFAGFAAAPADYLRSVAAFRDISRPSFDDLRVNRAEGADGKVVPSGIITGSALSELRGRLLPPDAP